MEELPQLSRIWWPEEGDGSFSPVGIWERVKEYVDPSGLHFWKAQVQGSGGQLGVGQSGVGRCTSKCGSEPCSEAVDVTTGRDKSSRSGHLCIFSWHWVLELWRAHAGARHRRAGRRAPLPVRSTLAHRGAAFVGVSCNFFLKIQHLDALFPFL